MKKIFALSLVALGAMSAVIPTGADETLYALPDGAFVRGWVAGKYGYAVKGNTQVLAPSGAALTYRNLAGASGSWQYSVYDIESMAWTQQSADAVDLTVPAQVANTEACAAPTLTVGGKTYTAGDLANVGNSAVKIGEDDGLVAYMPHSFGAENTEVFCLPEFSINQQRPIKLAGENTWVGFHVAKPAAPYGVKGVVWQGYINCGWMQDNFRFEIHKVGEGNTLGELIASGTSKDSRIGYSNSNVRYVSFAMLNEQGLVNIDDEIVVLFTGWRESGWVLPVVSMSCDPGMIATSSAVFIENPGAEGATFQYWKDNVSYSCPQVGGKSLTWNIVDYGFGLLVENTQIVSPDKADLLTVKFNDGQDSRTITLTPDYAITPAAVESRAGEWYTVDLGEWNADTHEQTVTVTVEPSDEQREATYPLEIPGARTYLTILQNKETATGAELVVSDVDVVASEYYDLTGRRLNRAPEAGVVIRRDIMGDGTARTSKLAF